jgi:hypothetical protein
MKITRNLRIYLVLNKLASEDKAVFDKNLEPFFTFQVSPNSRLLCSEGKTEGLIELITKDVKEYDKITLIELQGNLLGKGFIGITDDRKTVFDK